MSGTSLDGLDIVFADYSFDDTGWKYSIRKAETIPYPDQWVEKLSSATHCTGEEIHFLDVELGIYFGKKINDFISGEERPDFVSSHGHTIFHQPEKNLTLQIGSGIAIYLETRLPVINDFRSLDVLLGGQGAPLVPMGDKLLFGNFDVCVNLGGIANLSFEKNGSRIAYDICPFNILLNHFIRRKGMSFDAEGRVAASGKIQSNIKEFLESCGYYSKDPPKSLGYEQIESEMIIPLEKIQVDIPDLMRTLAEHMAEKIAFEIQKAEGKRILITGGGVYNTFIMKLISEKLSGYTISIPDKDTIEFKEALIFGLLGVLRIRGEINVLKSVTGASRNSISGTIIGEFKPGSLLL